MPKLEDFFIPPPGAMQFHYKNRRDGITPPIGEFACWVSPFVPPVGTKDHRINPCACETFYMIHLDSLPMAIQTMRSRARSLLNT